MVHIIHKLLLFLNDDKQRERVHCHKHAFDDISVPMNTILNKKGEIFVYV
jgi:hypothetical protein